MTDIFEKINQFAKDEGMAENFDIEHAVQVVPSQNVVVSGVQFEATEFHAPLFLSSGELRELADEADKRTQAILDAQQG